MSHLNSSPLAQESAPKRTPVLCYVTDGQALTASPCERCPLLVNKVAALGAAGVNWIQIREKDLAGRTLSALTRSALLHLSPLRYSPMQSVPRLLVNDRLDVALAEGANGVHLGENSLPVWDVKRLVATALHRHQDPRRDFLVGVSCHSLEGAQRAARAGADYLFFGPVFATPSKAGYGAPQGLERLAQVCASVAIPVLAIGGITLTNAASCWHAGASGIAAIRLFQDAADPPALLAALRRAMS